MGWCHFAPLVTAKDGPAKRTKDHENRTKKPNAKNPNATQRNATPKAERMKAEQSAELRATAERIRRAPELAAAVVGIASSVRAIAVLETLADRLESGDLEDS